MPPHLKTTYTNITYFCIFRIVSLENLRERLEEHDKVPYDDPECRGDLYILAPMRLLTPVLEETGRLSMELFNR